MNIIQGEGVRKRLGYEAVQSGATWPHDTVRTGAATEPQVLESHSRKLEQDIHIRSIWTRQDQYGALSLKDVSGNAPVLQDPG